MRCSFVLTVACVLGSAFAFGQISAATSPAPVTATCNFNDQMQLAVQYQRLTLGKEGKDFLGHEAKYGQVWEPGEKALTLYTNTPLSIDGNSLAAGAYTLYLIPDRKDWTLIVSKNTDVGAKYDKSKDLVRARMDVGQLPSPEPDFSVYLAHSSPKVCTMRVDVADTRAWVPFEQK